MKPAYNQASTEGNVPIESLPSLLKETEKEWNIYEEGLTESRGSPRESENENGELPRMLEEGEDEDSGDDVSGRNFQFIYESLINSYTRKFLRLEPNISSLLCLSFCVTGENDCEQLWYDRYSAR